MKIIYLATAVILIFLFPVVVTVLGEFGEPKHLRDWILAIKCGFFIGAAIIILGFFVIAIVSLFCFGLGFN